MRGRTPIALRQVVAHVAVPIPVADLTARPRERTRGSERANGFARRRQRRGVRAGVVRRGLTRRRIGCRTVRSTKYSVDTGICDRRGCSSPVSARTWCSGQAIPPVKTGAGGERGTGAATARQGACGSRREGRSTHRESRASDGRSALHRSGRRQRAHALQECAGSRSEQRGSTPGLAAPG